MVGRGCRVHRTAHQLVEPVIAVPRTGQHFHPAVGEATHRHAVVHALEQVAGLLQVRVGRVLQERAQGPGVDVGAGKGGLGRIGLPEGGRLPEDRGLLQVHLAAAHLQAAADHRRFVGEQHAAAVHVGKDGLAVIEHHPGQLQPVHGLPGDVGARGQAADQVERGRGLGGGDDHQRAAQGDHRIVLKGGRIRGEHGQGGIVAEHRAEGRVGHHPGDGVVELVVPRHGLLVGVQVHEHGVHGVPGREPAQRRSGIPVGQLVEMGEADRGERVRRQVAGRLAPGRRRPGQVQVGADAAGENQAEKQGRYFFHGVLREGDGGRRASAARFRRDRCGPDPQSSFSMASMAAWASSQRWKARSR